MRKRDRSKIVYFGIGALIVLVILGVFIFNSNKIAFEETDIGDFNLGEIKIASDGTKYIVSPDKIRSGGSSERWNPKYRRSEVCFYGRG